MYYSSKRFLVQVERPEQEGEIHTIYGTLPVKPTDILATDEFGTQFIMSDQYFSDNYVPVKKVNKTKTPRKSPFEMAEIEEAYKQNWVNQDDYIFDIKK
jgi:hypothetical protein